MPGMSCVVPSCLNKYVKTKGSNVSYHRFPQEEDVRSKWMSAVFGNNQDAPASWRICSQHFTAEDFDLDFEHQILGLPLRRILNKNAVPTCFVEFPTAMPSSKQPAEPQQVNMGELNNKREKHCEEFCIDGIKEEIASSRVSYVEENKNPFLQTIRTRFNAVKTEDSFTSNADDMDVKVGVKMEEDFTQIDEQAEEDEYKVKIEAVQFADSRNQDEYDESKKDSKIKNDDVEVEEHSLSSYEDYAYDVKVETVKSESTSDQVASSQLENRYKCTSCLYETNYKHRLAYHKLSHRNLSENTYKCPSCTYETKYRHRLIYHQRNHKNPSEAPVYKCETCSYQTKHKPHYNQHILVHKDPSEITMYACSSCPYKSKLQGNMKKHMIVHQRRPTKMTRHRSHTHETGQKTYRDRNDKNTLDVTAHTCEECSYTTKYKGHYNRHMLIHKNPSEVTTYKCETCTYETKRKQSLRYHELSHKNPSEVRMYDCEACSYKTKHKPHYKQHLLVHKSPADVTMYYCSVCSYTSKRRGNFSQHMSTHKNPTDVAQQEQVSEK